MLRQSSKGRARFLLPAPEASILQNSGATSSRVRIRLFTNILLIYAFTLVFFDIAWSIYFSPFVFYIIDFNYLNEARLASLSSRFQQFIHSLNLTYRIHYVRPNNTFPTKILLATTLGHRIMETGVSSSWFESNCPQFLLPTKNIFILSSLIPLISSFLFPPFFYLQVPPLRSVQTSGFSINQPPLV